VANWCSKRIAACRSTSLTCRASCLQAEARRLEQLAGMAATDPFAGMATPASMHTTSGGSLHAGAGGRYNSVSVNSGSTGGGGHSGYPSRMASLNAASYGPSAPLSGSESLVAADADAIQALNHRLASLQRSGGSGEDREAVVDLLQRVLSGGLVRVLAVFDTGSVGGQRVQAQHEAAGMQVNVK